MVRSQIGNLTPSSFFGHNLCFKYPNGSCKPILDIYVLIAFQRYKEIFNIIKFDPYIRPLNFLESIKTPIPKMEAHLGVWGFIPSHFPTLSKVWNVDPVLHSWPAPLQALTLVVSPRLRLRHNITFVQLKFKSRRHFRPRKKSWTSYKWSLLW
jgi:hypothetical protein